MIRTSLLLFIICMGLFTSCNKNNNNQKDNESINDDKEILIEGKNIRVRDPFIFADEKTKTYYLYASIMNRTKNGAGKQGVEVYTSKDLQNWQKPTAVFEVPDNFWAKKWVWAPEMHVYKDKYYLFVTFTSNDLIEGKKTPPTENWPPYFKRGTQVLVADNPKGPFVPFKNGPHTSISEMTLDGTLWEENGQPFMVYCHEWVDIEDGTINLVKLKEDLSGIEGDSKFMFKASDAPWSTSLSNFNDNAFVTDGCYLYRTKTDKLLMIWSSFSNNSYSIGVVESTSGSIEGPWIHHEDRIFEADGGHGMIFKTFEGQLVITLHQPNSSPNERMKFYKLKDTGDDLVLDGRL